MRILIEKTFEDRETLENYIRTSFGEDPEKNREITIELPQATMDSFLLDETTTIYGVRVRRLPDSNVPGNPNPGENPHNPN